MSLEILMSLRNSQTSNLVESKACKIQIITSHQNNQRKKPSLLRKSQINRTTLMFQERIHIGSVRDRNNVSYLYCIESVNHKKTKSYVNSNVEL